MLGRAFGDGIGEGDDALGHPRMQPLDHAPLKRDHALAGILRLRESIADRTRLSDSRCGIMREERVGGATGPVKSGSCVECRDRAPCPHFRPPKASVSLMALQTPSRISSP